jgi:hypothetical protein
MKLTKRKGFNFFRSYYDVYNMLPPEEKIAFMDALLDRQFLGVKPTELKGMAEFAYVSQTNSIDSQVKGYEDKTKTKLNPLEVNNYTPTDGGNNTPTLQVQEEVQVEEEEKEQIVVETPPQINIILTEEVFIKRWCDARTHYDKVPTYIKRLTTFEQVDFKDLLRDYNLKDFEKAMSGMFEQGTYKATRLRPTHFLKRERFEMYLTCFTTKEKLFEDKKYKKQIDRI